MTPTILYGTAWKEDATERLTSLALAAGFRGIDTANQRKHYNEAAVGAAIAASGIARDELFIQSKFTSVNGQDHRLPYERDAAPDVQVAQSFASSLEHLRTDRIDSYVLHGPSTRSGLGDYDRAVWRAMERLHADGRTRHLGISNVALDQLEALCAHARVRPTFVQNRCYARTGWDRQIRTFCRNQGITYQGFSLLTANRAELDKPAMKQLAERTQRTIPQLVFGWAIAVGVLPLTGTSDPRHMREDLDSFTLSAGDVQIIEGIGA